MKTNFVHIKIIRLVYETYSTCKRYTISLYVLKYINLPYVLKKINKRKKTNVF